LFELIELVLYWLFGEQKKLTLQDEETSINILVAGKMQTPSAAKAQRVKTPDILQAAARKRATTPPSVAVQKLARDDDEDAWAAMAVANLRAGAQTPPTPMTPSAAGTPRSLPGFELDKEGQGTPPSPRSEGSEPIATPPSEDYNEDDRKDHLEMSEQPTASNTSGTMGWVAEVHALIPKKVEKARWVGASGYDDMRDIGDISGTAHFFSHGVLDLIC
jgi:hypothetical protein